MKITWIHLLLGSLFVALAPACHADPVELAVSGHLYGEFAVYPGSTNSEFFTLNQDTQGVGISVVLYPYLYAYPLGPYEVTLTAPGGAMYAVSGDPLVTATPLPNILPEGNYSLNVIGGQCADPGISCVIAGIDYYLPATYTEIGGTILGGSSFAFELSGETTVPEPASWLLGATSILCLSVLCYRRRLANSAETYSH